MSKVINIVSGLTCVDFYLLVENDEFMEMVRSKATIDELVDFVNNNF